MRTDYIGRYAPSPTGQLHIGNALAAVIAHARARQANGRFILRIEDLDRDRSRPGLVAQQLEDLRWLGIDWDEGPDVGGARGPYVQTEREARYAEAALRLLAAGHAYYCTCSRKQIAQATRGIASAPHGPADEGPRYPGTCRGRRERPEQRHSIRFLVPSGAITVHDALRGDYTQDVDASCGDFVIARADGMFAYQLAVVVDDVAMGISEVVRGGDLLHSTPRQILIYRAFGAPIPRFAHTPLVVAARDGSKLSKSEPRHTLAGLRAAGVDPHELRQRILALDLSRETVSIDELL